MPRNPASTERSKMKRKVGSAKGHAGGKMGYGKKQVHTSSKETNRGKVNY